MLTKTCIDCKEDKSADHFNKNKSKRDGLQSVCRECQRARYRKNADIAKEQGARRYRENKERHREQGRAWYLGNRERARELGAKWYAENKERARVSQRINYAANREQRLTYSAEWKRQNADKVAASGRKRRAAKAGAYCDNHSPAQLAYHLALFAPGCFYCGAEFIEDNPRHLDHVTPLALGGAHALTNLVPACARCNLRKNKMSPAEWAEFRTQPTL